MKYIVKIISIVFAILLITASITVRAAENDSLPSWNDGAPKQAILDFVSKTTDKNSPDFIPENERIAVFDQDGTLWVEQPIYTQFLFALDQVVAMSAKHPEWKKIEPFKSVIAHDKKAIANFTMMDLEQLVVATHTGMTAEQYQETVKNWIAQAKNARWDRPYTEMIYQPMSEVMSLLRANGYKTYIVTGGGQDFVRVYADHVYGVSRDEVIGSAFKMKYTYDKKGKGILMRTPKLLLNNNYAGKPEDIYLFLGRHPRAAFGNSTGDQQMLEYTQASNGANLMMLVHHDDPKREYAYGSKSKVGTFSEELMSEAKKRGWYVISMKNDWKRIFPFEQDDLSDKKLTFINELSLNLPHQ